MKRNVKVLLMLMTAILAFIKVSAQSPQNGEPRMCSEDVTKARANSIADKLGIDQSAAHEFVDLYSNFRKEICDSCPRQNVCCASGNKNRSAHCQAYQDLQNKYRKDFCKILTPEQIEKFYELENTMPCRYCRNMNGKGRRGKGRGYCYTSNCPTSRYASASMCPIRR